MTLGLKNNNPANIRYNSLNKWKHQGKPNKGFCTFDSPVWGVRALLIILRKYRYSYGLTSVEKIVSRFAPPNENDTALYVKSVSSFLEVDPSDCLLLDFFYFGEGSVLYRLCYAICKIESTFELDVATWRTALSLVDSFTMESYNSFRLS